MKRSKLSPVLVAPVSRQAEATSISGGVEASNGTSWDPRPPFAGVDASNGSPWDPRPPFAGAEACGWE